MTLRCSIICTRLLLTACYLLIAEHVALAVGLKEDPKVTQLRTDLTSKNSEPNVENQGTRPIVVINKDFSWNEQARVRGVISGLAKNPTEELVTQLLVISYSSSYCISTINDNEYIHNYNVGQVAAHLIEAIIETPFKEAFADVPPDDTNPFKRALQLENSFTTGEVEKFLIEDRLKLYEVQLKQLEKSKAELLKKYPDDKLAAEVIKKIDVLHKTISDNKKPMLRAIAYPIKEEYFDKHESSRAKISIVPSPK